MHRWKEFRTFYIEAVEKLAKAELDVILKQERPDISPDSYHAKFDREKGALLQAKILFDPQIVGEVASGLFSHIWIFGENTSQQPFYTSDNPIAKYAHGRTVGIISPGIEIAFPLTSNKILVMLERSHFKEFEVSEGKIIPYDITKVNYYNRLQVIDSYRHIYCSTDNFTLAQEICEREPEICNPERDRIKIN